jgi:hypothetical protein
MRKPRFSQTEADTVSRPSLRDLNSKGLTARSFRGASFPRAPEASADVLTTTGSLDDAAREHKLIGEHLRINGCENVSETCNQDRG